MPVIRPVSDLRDKTPEIEEICINEQKPVFITKNGSSHLVVMSDRLFQEQQTLLSLYEKLDKAKEQSRSRQSRPFREAMSELRNKI